jgi:hypothetical protein
MRKALVTLVGLLLLVSAPALAQYQFITDYYGFSWEEPVGAPPLQPGNTYQMVGLVDAVLPPLTANFSANEYTFAILNAVQNGPALVVGAGFDYRGAFTIYQVNYADGSRFQVWEDPSFNHNWGINPPNATSPSTFIDGTLYLDATSSHLVVYINLYGNGDEIGSFETDLVFTGGSHVGQLGGPGQTGYSFAGLTKKQQAAIPQGYKERVDGQELVTPVEPTTWGGIKSLYKR